MQHTLAWNELMHVGSLKKEKALADISQLANRGLLLLSPLSLLFFFKVNQRQKTHLSNSSAQFSGRLIPGCGHAGQKMARSPCPG
jgi:hypothetical protein